MKKASIITSLILVSAMAVSAQAGSKGELARLRRNPVRDKKVSTSGRKSITRAPGVLRVGPSTTYLKKGLNANEVVRFLGHPASVSERREGDLRLATYTFTRGEERVLVAEFENGVLVRSYAEARQAIVRNRN
jgi:hypothetical protein